MRYVDAELFSRRLHERSTQLREDVMKSMRARPAGSPMTIDELTRLAHALALTDVCNAALEAGEVP